MDIIPAGSLDSKTVEPSKNMDIIPADSLGSKINDPRSNTHFALPDSGAPARSTRMNKSKSLVNLGASSTERATHITTTADFVMKMPNAMLKKLNACNRENPIKVKHTNGGLRLFLQGGFYEVFKAAVIAFTESPAILLIKKVDQKDAKQRAYAHIFTIATNDRPYTINLYNADSSGLVNGGGVSHFLSDHLHQILRGIKEAFPSRHKLLAINRQVADLI